MNSALSDDSSPSGQRHLLGSSEAQASAGAGSSTSITQTHAHFLGVPAQGEAQDRTVISQRPVAAPAEFVRSLSLVELARTLEGRTLDHFAVERMIGGGGMGAVFRGKDLRLDREVAIKVIPESRRDPETLRRFRMEAQSAARLDHPNIARVFDIGENDTWNYIVFEFIDGINLRDLVLTNGPMTIDDAVFTTRQVAEALQHAHERDVVHRDIKPSNVIITPSGIAKVVDMGLARNTAMDRSTADQTASGVTLGTFDYISPEQARDPRDADVRSDLYSLGCTLFYMLTSQPPFPDGTALQKLLNHGSQPPPDPRQWRDDISDQLAAVLSKLMAKRPSDRYQKPLELINDLLLVAQLESLPRSASAGTIMLTPAIAQRSLLEIHLPWLVPLCVLIGSVFWLQSAESFSSPLDMPQPELNQPVGPNRPITPAAPMRTSDEPAPINFLPGDPAGEKLLAAKTASEQTAPGSVKSNPAKPLTEPDRATPPTSPGENTDKSLIEANDTKARANGNERSLTTAGADRVAAERAGGERPATERAAGERAGSERTGTDKSLTGQPSAADEAALAETRPAQSDSTAAPQNNLALSSNASGPAKSDDSPLSASSDSVTGGAGRNVSAPAFAGDLIVVSQQSTSSSRWAPSLSAALMQAAMNSEIRTIELRESVELTSPVVLPRSGLTIRSGPGAKVELTLSGSDAFGMGWESWFELDRKSLRCQGLRIRCMNDMRQHQAVFAMRSGAKLELEDCMITMDAARDPLLGNCILIKDGPKASAASGATNANTTATVPLMPSTSSSLPSTLMPSNSATTVMPMPGATGSGDATGTGTAAITSFAATLPEELEPVTLTVRNSVIRGAQSLLTMRTVCRAEITLENVCAMLEGRVLTIRSDDDKGVPPVVRMNLQRSTFATLQGFAAIQAAAATRAPLVLMRTARLCAFWSPTAVSHMSIDGIADQEILDKLLLLRGEENAYDQNVENLVQCRLTDGQHVQFRLNDLSGEWFRELGYENSLRWQTSVPPDRPMQDQLPADYSLKDSMYLPGYR